MDELKRLVRLVVERSSRYFPLINQQDEKSLETRFFNLIRQGDIASDEDAAAALYGKRALSANYRMLKSRMRKRLLNHLHRRLRVAGRADPEVHRKVYARGKGRAAPPGDAFAEAEIVPCENLWEAVLIILKHRGNPR